MSKLRLAVFAICGIMTVLAAAMIFQLYNPPPSEAIGRSIATGISTIVGVSYALFILPALVLALLDRHLRVALILSLLAIPAAFLALQMA